MITKIYNHILDDLIDSINEVVMYDTTYADTESGYYTWLCLNVAFGQLKLDIFKSLFGRWINEK